MDAYRVKLTHRATNTTVVFDAAPEISENGVTSYRTIEPVHSPGGIQVFSNTTSRTFQLSGIKLFSRTQEEATRNYDRLMTIKSWRYPVFGASATTSSLDATSGLQLGQPPAVLELSAYAVSGAADSAGGLINRVPVVITNLSIMYPTDCDYIPTVAITTPAELRHIPTGIPMPTILPIDISLLESHAPAEYEKFSLADLKQGKMVGF